MTFRDEIAMMAAEVFLERWPKGKFLSKDDMDHIAKVSYEFADSMITASGGVDDRGRDERG